MITTNKYEVYIILIFGIAGINDTGKASISDFLVNSQTGILLVTQPSCCVYIWNLLTIISFSISQI